MKKVCEMLAWYKILYYLCNRERERQTLHDSKFNHKTNTIMKAIDFLTVTSMNEARYSDYILFKAEEAVNQAWRLLRGAALTVCRAEVH